MQRPPVHPDTVVLTGATGALGAHILHLLETASKRRHIICLCRAQDASDARDRVQASLKRRRLASVDNSQVVCLVADLAQDQLGLSPVDYQRVANASLYIHASLPAG
jgi:thioester reductase-like protein